MVDSDIRDYVETKIGDCGSADGLAEAACQILYQVKAREGAEDVADLQAAYSTVKAWVAKLAGIEDEYLPVLDDVLASYIPEAP